MDKDSTLTYLSLSQISRPLASSSGKINSVIEIQLKKNASIDDLSNIISTFAHFSLKESHSTVISF